jgi:chromosomal replication initiation ATPase DnaA
MDRLEMIKKASSNYNRQKQRLQELESLLKEKDAEIAQLSKQVNKLNRKLEKKESEKASTKRPERQVRQKANADLAARTVEAAICKNFQIKQISAKSRKIEQVQARRVAYYALREYLGWSNTDIASHFNVTHSTVFNVIKKIAWEWPAVNNAVDEICVKLASLGLARQSR